MTEHPKPIDAIFHEALRHSDSAARERFLRDACGNDAELRAQVDRLLAAVGQMGDFLNQPAVSPGDADKTAELPRGEVHTGQTIGPYKLLQKLGEGGMGVVYMAEQEQPVRRRVAVKVIRAGMDSAQVAARFENERQALALMDHPNIARVIDADVTSDGRPYFAMELVHGIPITKYCDQETLSLEQRIQLFIPVCRAVQHAHQKGIIHRDLKPSNVIVGLYDGQPIPKVIDFGVAKATGQRLVDQTMFTEIGQIIGTIEYMAPEQAEMNNLDIDTRADVYSLGVLLYELLTGAPPFTAQVLRKAGFGEMLRIIKEVEPTKPSTKITSAEDLPRVAANRRLEPTRLARSVRGDLDWITMKCLEKTRGRRYETANGLAQDLERFLANEPVQACPPTAGYRLRKFISKHRRLIGGAAAFACLLIAATTLSVWQAVRASRAESRAIAGWTEAEVQRDDALEQRRRTREALDTILAPEGMDWITSQERLSPSQKAFLEKVVGYYQVLAAETATDLESGLMVANASLRVGDLLTALGQLNEAKESFSEGTRRFEGLAEKFPEDGNVKHGLARVLTATGTLYENMGKNLEMERSCRRAIEYLDPLLRQSPDQAEFVQYLATNLRRLGLALRMQDQHSESIAAYRRAVETVERLSGVRSTVNATALKATYQIELGWALHSAGQVREAKEAFETAAGSVRQLTESPDTKSTQTATLTNAYRQLSFAYLGLNEWQKAEDNLRLLIPHWETRAAEQPTVPVYRLQLSQVHAELGEALTQQRKWAEAETALARSVELGESLLSQFPRSRGASELNTNRVMLANALLMLDQRAEAQAHFDKALASAEAAEQLPLKMHWSYGLALSGAIDEALAQIESISAEVHRRASRADGGWQEYGIASIYALAAQDNSDPSKAESLAQQALTHLRNAIDDGWQETKFLREDPDMDSLRQRADFKQVVSELETRIAVGSDPAESSRPPQ